jgi:hypothetical protein
MKKVYTKAIYLLCAGIFFLAFFLLYNHPLTKTVSFFYQSDASSAKPDFPDKALLYEIIKTREPATGTVPSEKLFLARQVQLQKFIAQQQTGIQSPVPGIGWTERGPDNIGGRTRAVMYDVNDPTGKKVWAGGVGGGLWYTTDITATPTAWNKISDTLNNLAISCITQGKSISNRMKMFFGTGEGWGNIDAIRGNGIWRSLDGGVTWTHLLSTRDNPSFRFVQDILYAENAGGPCGFGTPGVLASTVSGVYKSVDDGDTWTKVLGAGFAGAAINAAADLESSYYYTFATLGLINTGGGGIYRSCNAGATWEEIYHASPDEERIEIAEHYLDAWEVYAVVQDETRGVKKIMKSDNADTVPASAVVWKTKILPAFCNLSGATEFSNKQAWYDIILGVAPFFRNPPANDHHATAYVGGVDLHKTTTSGSVWNQVCEWDSRCGKPYVHADKHNIIFKPDPVNAQYFPNEFLIATDGGIYRSTDGGVSFNARNKTYNITQFYSCAFHPTNTNYFLAGSQDNGTQKFTAAGMNSTTNISASDHDGGFCYIDRDNPQVQITSYIANNYFVSTDGGANFTYFPKNDSGQFINPTDYDHTGNILYGGDASGNYFRWTNPAGNGATETVSVTAFNGAQVTFVILSPTVLNRVYFGLSNGSIVQVNDANTGTVKTGVVIRPDLGSDYFLSCIAIDPGNEDHMLAAYSNYGVTKLYESSPGTGGSLTWSSVQGDLPDMPVRWCMFDPRNNDWAILATEKGIWSTDDLNASGTTNWSPTNNSIANTRIDMLRYRSSDRLLLAATHGRGLFSTLIPVAALPVIFSDFRARLNDNTVELSWITSSEQNSKEFFVEKSTDGVIFRTIGSVYAAGSSNSNRSYRFTDKEVVQENNFYRLRLVDNDDKYTYSRIVSVKNPLLRGLVFKILTNPFNDYIDLQFNGIEKGRAAFSLYNAEGKLLIMDFFDVVPNQRQRIYTRNKALAPGLYIVSMKFGANTYMDKLLKQ